MIRKRQRTAFMAQEGGGSLRLGSDWCLRICSLSIKLCAGVVSVDPRRLEGWRLGRVYSFNLSSGGSGRLWPPGLPCGGSWSGWPSVPWCDWPAVAVAAVAWGL